jgi:hypothetical protein
MSGLPTHIGTPNDQGHRATRWDSQLTSGLSTPIDPKTILRARGVLECLSYDLVLILELSIFLRLTRFASLFTVRHILNSRSKEYNHFNHLSLQCLHMSLLLNITSEGDAINFVSSLWANTAWACDLNHFNKGEFNPWLQVTSTNDLILNIIWLLMAQLVPRLNASTLFFTLAMVPRSTSHCLPFTFT